MKPNQDKIRELKKKHKIKKNQKKIKKFKLNLNTHIRIKAIQN